MDHLSVRTRLGLAAIAVLFLAGGYAALKTSPRASASAAHLCLAQAVHFEARGEPHAGQFGVASVVLNRVAHGGYPDTVCAVVFEGSARRNACQFSFACDGLSDRAAPGPAWHQSLRVAGQALAGLRPDITGRATHYHALSVDPVWAKDLTQTVTIGQHRFYHDRPSRLASR
jgi:spore germination cell wall hydrolase CwlJ-like protein